MAYGYSEFIGDFSEFADNEEAYITRSLLQTNIENNYFAGITDETTRNYALGLATAHSIICDIAQASGSGGSAVKRVKSRNEEIEYNSNPADPFAYETTAYGVRLERLINAQYLAGSWRQA